MTVWFVLWRMVVSVFLVIVAFILIGFNYIALTSIEPPWNIKLVLFVVSALAVWKQADLIEKWLNQILARMAK